MNPFVYKTLEELSQNRVFYHFLQLCNIPRQTFFEKEISDFIFHWAKHLQLEVQQDQKYNLLIRKPATKGYEKEVPILLQAHMDMVCEKRENVEHDFKRDPIKPKLEGDILSTGNKTTLGADDGIGVAIAMTILESKDIKHPPIDVIFTTGEEEDMSGALNLDSSWFHTHQIINLDHSVDTELVAGSSGGKGVELKIPLEYVNIPEDYISYQIKIYGLMGGHSGEDIDKGLANANILLGRFLYFCQKQFYFLLSDIKGGSFRLAIPIEASASISIPKECVTIFQHLTKIFTQEIQQIYRNTEKELNLEILEENFHKKAISSSCSQKITNTLFLAPNGISEMLGNPKVVESSCNLGEIYISDSFLFMITEIRAISKWNTELIYQKISLLAEQVGGELRDFSPYPSWIYNPSSRLRKLAEKTYLQLFGKEMKIVVLHAGLECSCFSSKVSNMDAISIGPNIWNLHSPYEALSVSSTIKIYLFLVKILESLCTHKEE